MDAVRREFALRATGCGLLAGSGARLAATCYVGGGTPSCLEPDLFAALLAGTWDRLSRASDAEVTAEANPETFTAPLAAAWRGAGVNRISLGVQSLDPGVLALLGRSCGPGAAREALRLASRTFGRVSADWILAPGCRPERLRAEFAEARDLGVGHVSLYILEVHEGTPLAEAVAAGRLRLPPREETERIYLEARADLAGLGYAQYEVSNFCLPGEESRHNAAYWRRAPYLGLGPGAHGFWGRRRYANHGDLERYTSEIERGRLPEASCETLDRRARLLEKIILPLRTRAGVPLADLPVAREWLARGAREGLWRLDRGRLRLSGKGLLHIDEVEAAFSRNLDSRSMRYRGSRPSC